MELSSTPRKWAISDDSSGCVEPDTMTTFLRIISRTEASTSWYTYGRLVRTRRIGAESSPGSHWRLSAAGAHCLGCSAAREAYAAADAPAAEARRAAPRKGEEKQAEEEDEADVEVEWERACRGRAAAANGGGGGGGWQPWEAEEAAAAARRRAPSVAAARRSPRSMFGSRQFELYTVVYKYRFDFVYSVYVYNVYNYNNVYNVYSI